MAEILFNKNVEFAGFNLGHNGIKYPQSNNTPSDDDVDNSIVYSFVNNSMYNDGHISARYKSQALTRDKFIIYRQDDNNSNKTYLATINGVTDGFYDYNVANQQKYKYIVESNPADKKQDGSTEEELASVSLETEYFVAPHWQYWSICDIEKHEEVSEESMRDVYVPSDKVFLIKNNVEVGTINDNLNIIKYNTLGQYGKVIQNAQKYDSGNIQCLIGDFQMTQSQLGNKKIITNTDLKIKTEEDIDIFFANKQESSHHDNELHVYRFPNVNSKYYIYTPSYAKMVYVPVTQKPDNWELTFDSYYQYDENQHTYNKVQYIYTEIDSSRQPDNWETKYLQYYYKQNGSYIQNTSNNWDKDITYYQYVVPPFTVGNYYQLVTHPWQIMSELYKFYNPRETFDVWRDCVSNGKLKLLKSPNGDIWIIQISDQNSIDIDWKSSSYPATISFNWQEVIDKYNITIIKW